MSDRVAHVGVDPGASGGLVLISPAGTVTSTKMPDTDRDVWDWFRAAADWPGTVRVVAVIEQVQGFIGEGQPGSSMFKFGRSYGSLLMALTAAEISFVALTPQAWQKGLGIAPKTKTEDKTAWKNRLKGTAQRLFPGTDVTLAVADALLIAEFCRRSHPNK